MWKTKKMKKISCLFIVFMMLAAIFAGCGGSNKQSENQEIVKLKHWVWLDNPNDPTFKEMVAEFNESHPGIQVDVEIIGWNDYYTKMLTATAGGDAPDTAAFKLTWIPAFTSNNALLPLDDYLKKWKGKSDILDNLWDVFNVAKNGKSYLMPWELQILYMYYRPSLFKEAGVQIPETWEEFVVTCKKLTKDKDGDGKIDQYGFGMRGARYGHEPWGSLIVGYGGKFTDEKGNIALNSPEAIAGNQVFLDLFIKDKVVPLTAPADGFAEIIGNFESGKTAMVVHHIKSSPQMVAKFGDDVSAFPIPKGPKGQWTSMGDTENVIFKQSQHPQEAFTFIAWLAEKEQVDRWCRASGNVPVSKSIQELDYYQSNRFMKASFDSASFAGVYPVLPSMGEWIESLWPATIQRALMGQISGPEAIKILHDGMAKN